MIKLSEHYFKLANNANIISKIDPGAFRKFVAQPGRGLVTGLATLGIAKSGLPELLGAGPGTTKFLSGSAPVLGYNVGKVMGAAKGMMQREADVIDAMRKGLITPEQLSIHYLRDVPIFQHANKFKRFESMLGKDVMSKYKDSFILKDHRIG
jgi:hypothetical protein